MKLGAAALLILMSVPAPGLAQRIPAQPAERTASAAIGARPEAEADAGRPRAEMWNNRAATDRMPAPTRSPYGNGIRTPWQDNPIRTPWQ